MHIRGPCYALAVLLCLTVPAGCADRDAPALRAPSEGADGDSILALVERVDDAAMHAAFEGLAELSYSRYHRTEQFTAGGTRLAFIERLVRITSQGVHDVASDSSGEFDFGYLRRFVSAPDDAAMPAELSSYVLPEDPAYASARNREAYRYELVSDTMLHARPVRLVHITARPRTGDGQSIRRADLYLEEGSDRLVGIYLERIDAALWFHEVSALFLSIDRLSSGRWVPKHARFETLINMPFRPEHRFRTVFSYFAFGPAT